MDKNESLNLNNESNTQNLLNDYSCDESSYSEDLNSYYNSQISDELSQSQQGVENKKKKFIDLINSIREGNLKFIEDKLIGDPEYIECKNNNFN